MIVKFSEIIQEIIRGLGMDSETIESRVLESIKLRTNEAQDVVFYSEDWEWRQRSFFFTTSRPYETGTIALTQNNRTVTGSGTSWTDAMRVGYVLINSKIYKLQSVTSSTVLKLEAPYDGITATGLTYKIIFPDHPLNHEISSIVGVKYHGKEFSIKTNQRLQTPITSIGTPCEAAIHNRTNEDYYNTGLISVTINSNAVTGAGTTWSSEMEGMTFRINEFSKEFTILSVNSATSLTLRELYDGATGSGKTYKINPLGMALLTLRAVPDDYYYLEIEALIKPIKLINNDDISLIPNHMPLIRYAIWLAMADLENKNPVKMQQAQADAKRTLDQLRDSYRIIANVQWRSENETRNRTPFDPLRRR